MKILSSEQVRAADAYTIENDPITSTDLMERAAKACADFILKHFTDIKDYNIFCGPGNNGGDGLVISRYLIEAGKNVSTIIVWFTDSSSKDFETNLNRLKSVKNHRITEIRSINEADALEFDSEFGFSIDALLGSGLTKPISGILAPVVEKINQSKFVISIDIPSGLHGEFNSDYRKYPIVKADLCLALEMPKLALLLPENAEYSGDFSIIPIGLNSQFINNCESKYYLTLPEDIQPHIKKRNKFAHKNDFGHALLVAGSSKMGGAAVLAAKTCISSGVGLLTVHSAAKNRNILLTILPEAMFEEDENMDFITSIKNSGKYDAIGIGPGIGTDQRTAACIKVLIQEYKGRMIFDADALNILSENKTWLAFLPKGSILTPHEGEFERLVGKWRDEKDKLDRLIDLSVKHHVYIVLKGAHTIVACPDKSLHFNSSGNPGMACAGSGDTLTGIILALLAQGYHPKLASIIGVYIHGLAGDFAADKKGIISMSAGDICKALPQAFKKTIF